MQNRVFFPQVALDQWVSEDKIELDQRELVIKPEGRRYRTVDALRILGEVSGTGDLYGIVGKVKTLNFLTELGAELLGRSMLIGDSAYDVEPGLLGLPVGNLLEEVPEAEEPTAPGYPRRDPQSDEELLARHLMERL